MRRRPSKSTPTAERMAASRTTPPSRTFSYRASRTRQRTCPSVRLRQASSSSSSRAAARLTWVEDRLSRPNSAITFAASRVETPWTYIWAMASMTARDERRPRVPGLGEERLLAAAALGDAKGERARRRVHGLRFVAVRVASARLGALVEPRAEMLVTLHPHREVEERREGLRHALGAGLDELFHQRGDDPVVVILHPVPLFPDRENRNGAEPSHRAHAPRLGSQRPYRRNFQMGWLHHPGGLISPAGVR